MGDRGGEGHIYVNLGTAYQSQGEGLLKKWTKEKAGLMATSATLINH